MAPLCRATGSQGAGGERVIPSPPARLPYSHRQQRGGTGGDNQTITPPVARHKRREAFYDARCCLGHDGCRAPAWSTSTRKATADHIWIRMPGRESFRSLRVPSTSSG
jgi:hypothetical protein